ncbi:hypothetical protein B7P43_G05289 [Cryptotermes secundus]|uniref:Zinc finger protein chinmo n=1 Tax=Cryptotermes secundus TaxID=105785 RepID=A0A2J7R638_9NEOP|nr:hypothetical protein B7P43_G05289 [Cryptotermes secundus]
MDSQQQFCLKWNSFGSNLATAFGNLFKSESLTDVTLFCEGVTFKAHKLILAACSKHFQDMFQTAPLCSSVLVILDGTSSSNMSALLEFMYKGEVHVSQDSLPSFLKAAECLQVKGLSVEHEKLAVVQGQHISSVGQDSQLDSPTGDQLLQHHPSTSSTSYSPVMSPYMHPPHYRPAYEQRVPASAPPPSHYDASSRKRHHRSSSETVQDSAVRASVLRDGSKSRTVPEPEKHSPISLAYRPVSQPQQPQEPELKSDEKVYPPSSSASQHLLRYEGGPDHRDNTANAPANAAATVTYDRAVAVEVDGNNKATPESRRSSVDPGSSCPEDLRVKLELSSRPEEHHVVNAAPYTETSADKISEIIPSTPWNSSTSTKLAVHKGGSVATADGKKLKCPFCERLYGYETNLRAHIRQRHQGIRVPCPFCNRTFTRNNTVRRHIAREHKTEYGLKAFQPQAQVHNHNNQ